MHVLIVDLYVTGEYNITRNKGCNLVAQRRREKSELDSNIVHKYLGSEYLKKTLHLILAPPLPDPTKAEPSQSKRGRSATVSAGFSVHRNARIECCPSGSTCLAADPDVLHTYGSNNFPNLFLHFARAGGSAEDSLAFCERFGIPEIDNAGDLFGDGRPAVRLSLFRAAAMRMRFFLALIEALQAGAEGYQFLARHKADVLRLARFYQARLIHVPHSKPHWVLDQLEEQVRDNPIEGACLLVRLQSSFYLSGARTLVLDHEDDRTPIAQTVTVSFLSTVYLQAVDWFRPGRGVGFCEACGDPFPKTRSDKRHCDDSCSALARVRRSREKRASGKRG